MGQQQQQQQQQQPGAAAPGPSFSDIIRNVESIGPQLDTASMQKISVEVSSAKEKLTSVFQRLNEAVEKANLRRQEDVKAANAATAQSEEAVKQLTQALGNTTGGNTNELKTL